MWPLHHGQISVSRDSWIEVAQFSDAAKVRLLQRSLLVGVLGLNLQLCLAGFTDPMMLTIDEGMVMDALAVVSRANVTLHGCNADMAEWMPYYSSFVSTLKTPFSVSIALLSGI